MNDSANGLQRALIYVLQLAVLSLVLSCAVKYGGPFLQVPEKPAIALAMLLTPALVVLIWLIGLQGKSEG